MSLFPMFVSLIWMLLAVSCKSRDSVSSETKHTFGKTRREPTGELGDCTQKTFQELARRDDVESPEATAYVRKIAAQVMKANPDTFSGVYDPSKICLYVVKRSDVNASAASDIRNIFFNTGMLEIMDNDAELASVISHELSHITMQHVMDQPYEKLEESEEWKTAGRKLQDELKAIEAKSQAIFAENNKLEEQLGQQGAELDQKASAAMNSEREALTKEAQSIQTELLDSDSKYPADSIERDLLRGLWMAILPGKPRFYGIPREEDKLQEPDAIQLLPDLVNKIKNHNDRVKALNEKEKKAFPTQWAALEKTIKSIREVPARLAVVSEESAQKEKEILALKEKIVGSALYNWAEEEADDVGFELYLRAGWSPAFYSNIFFKHLAAKNEDVAACKALLQVQTEPERGKGFHPSNCWRVYNATIEEMNDHKHPYSELVKNANRLDLFPGELAKIQAAIRQ